MQNPFAKPSKLALALASALSLAACSSTIELQEPKMTPIESEYQLKTAWKVFQGSLDKHDAEALVFAFDEAQVYVANNNGRLSAIKLASNGSWSNQLIWQTGFEERIISGPVLDGSNLLIGTSKGRVKALEVATGEVVWQTQLSSEVLSAAEVHGDKLYTRTADGKVYALSKNSGEVIWASEHQMPLLSLRGAPPILATDEFVFVGWESGILQALQAQSGELVWESRVAIPSGRTDLERMVDIQASLSLRGNTLFAMGFHGKFVAINIETGNFQYVKDISGYRDFVVGEQAIFLVDETDTLQALDLFMGTVLWKQASMKGRSINDLQVYKDNLVAADAWGYIHWFNALQGTEFARVKHSNTYGDGNRITRLQVKGSSLFVMDETGAITRYEVEKSDLLQFREQIAADTGEPVEALNQPQTQPEEALVEEKKEGEPGFFSKLWPF